MSLGRFGGAAQRLRFRSGGGGLEGLSSLSQQARDLLAPTPEGQPADSFQVQEGLRGISHNLVFSSTDQNTVSWTTGTITLSDGTAYTIDAGNTGNMTDPTYIYLDVDVSTTALQTTSTAGTAIGSRKLLLALAEDNADADDVATFLVFGGSGGWGGTWAQPANITKLQCSLKNSADESIADNTRTTLTFDGENFDTDGMHSTVSNTGRITFTTAGVYAVVGWVSWETDVDGIRTVLLAHNNGTNTEDIARLAGDANSYDQTIAVVRSFAAGDYVTLDVLHTAGNALEVNVFAAGRGTNFSAYRVY